MLFVDDTFKRVHVNMILMNESRHIFEPDEKLLTKILRLLPGNDLIFKYNEIIYRIWRHQLTPDGGSSGHLLMYSFPDDKESIKRYRVDISEKLGKNITMKEILQLANLLQIAEIHDV